LPIISAYVEQVSRFLARRRAAKMEGKLHSTRSEIAGRFGNFFLNILDWFYLRFDYIFPRLLCLQIILLYILKSEGRL
jgi:hypothetical protein